MTIKQLQNFINEYNKKLENKFGKIEDNEKRILSSTVKLTEELGELCNEVMTHNGRQRKEKLVEGFDNIPNEFADVILATFMLAKDMNIDIEKALNNKIKTIKTKYDFLKN